MPFLGDMLVPCRVDQCFVSWACWKIQYVLSIPSGKSMTYGLLWLLHDPLPKQDLDDQSIHKTLKFVLPPGKNGHPILPIFDPPETCQFVSAYLRVLVTVCDQDLRSALDIHIYLFSVYIYIYSFLFIYYIINWTFHDSMMDSCYSL